MAKDEELIPLDDGQEAIELSEGPGGGEAVSKIHSFGEKQEGEEKRWKRKTNATGQGAVRVKTFHSALRHEALEHLDQRINEWLDAHPEYEVKVVTTTIGELVVKAGKEPAMFVSVWV